RDLRHLFVDFMCIVHHLAAQPTLRKRSDAQCMDVVTMHDIRLDLSDSLVYENAPREKVEHGQWLKMLAQPHHEARTRQVTGLIAGLVAHECSDGTVNGLELPDEEHEQRQAESQNNEVQLALQQKPYRREEKNCSDQV